MSRRPRTTICRCGSGYPTQIGKRFCSDLCRFEAKVIRTPGGCWFWAAAKNTWGYGSFHLGGVNVGAHRAAWELLVGPIPDGLHIDHLCRRPWCVNPLHLEPVAQIVNTLRGESRFAIRRRTNRCVNGHDYTPANTYRRGDGTTLCRTCHRVREAARRRELVAS